MKKKFDSKKGNCIISFEFNEKVSNRNEKQLSHSVIEMYVEYTENLSTEIRKRNNTHAIHSFCDGEFDSGSELTLAACLTHASRARGFLRELVKRRTGEQHVRIYPIVENTFEKSKLILHKSYGRKMAFMLSLKDELAYY